jgi:hypothetical protein
MPPLDAIATVILTSKANKKNQQKRETQIHQLERKGERREKQQKGCSTHHSLQDSGEHHMPSLEHQHDWDGVSLLGGPIQCLLWMQLQLCCCYLKQTRKINKKKKEKQRFISWKENEKEVKQRLPSRAMILRRANKEERVDSSFLFKVFKVRSINFSFLNAS